MAASAHEPGSLLADLLRFAHMRHFNVFLWLELCYPHTLVHLNNCMEFRLAFDVFFASE